MNRLLIALGVLASTAYCITVGGPVASGDEYRKWCLDRGVKFIESRLDFVEKNGVRGAYAQKAIKAGDALIDVPLALYFGPEVALKSSLGSKYQKLLDDELLTGGEIATFHLLYERQLPVSEWGPYIHYLPKEVPLVGYWPEEYYTSYFKNSPTFHFMKEYQGDVHAVYLRIKEHLVDKFPELFPAEHFSEDLWIWATSMVSSRSYDDTERGHDWTLMPGGDMTNHKFGSMELSEGNDIIQFTTNNDYVEGDEIFSDYGDKANTEFLLYYGFALEENENNVYYALVKNILAHFGKTELVGTEEWKDDTLREWGWDTSFQVPLEGDVGDLVTVLRLFVWGDEASAEDIDFSEGTGDCKIESEIAKHGDLWFNQVIGQYESLEKMQGEVKTTSDWRRRFILRTLIGELESILNARKAFDAYKITVNEVCDEAKEPKKPDAHKHHTEL